MTSLVFLPLETTLSQNVTVSGIQDRIHIGSFCPYVLMYNAPVGTFTFEFLSGATVLFSKTFTSTQIKTALSTTDNYAHIYYPLECTSPIQLVNGEYIMRITASGYTYSDSSYLGWIQQHENIQSSLSYTSWDVGQNPLTVRIKKWQE